jgi:hypothetical protein
LRIHLLVDQASDVKVTAIRDVLSYGWLLTAEVVVANSGISQDLLSNVFRQIGKEILIDSVVVLLLFLSRALRLLWRKALRTA